ncbi:hypothetical protein GUJ93_ZPchr0001g30960 [Zizania palustris]|uniref:Uncharacterized protein n=1 Tax=Zizania palustris TaxID=103762 RepID=A0A8J5RYG7_ZIZPA|nr:hypothetical protein GUJ93_ZPchr0001g30960 [Zizania palustris]
MELRAVFRPDRRLLEGALLDIISTLEEKLAPAQIRQTKGGGGTELEVVRRPRTARGRRRNKTKVDLETNQGCDDAGIDSSRRVSATRRSGGVDLT